MLTRIDLSTVRFAEPQYLWLLTMSGVLLAVWIWQLAARRRDVRLFLRRRRLPVRERFPAVGNLMFWLCVLLAQALTITALAQPQAPVSTLRTAGVDLVVLQDGSASMRTADVAGDRWKRSIRFLRTLGESLGWRDDRMAMALFAHIAVPQVRLTNDANTFFFFLDHLHEEPPFRLEDDTTWDTNIELGLFWGLRLISKDEELYGKNPNAKSFVLISDGQSWSGEVARSLALAKEQGIPVSVVGVGTATGGLIPEPALKPFDAWMEPPIRSALDRTSLRLIARAGGGDYYELDGEGDREIANRIITAARKRSGAHGRQVVTEHLYWPCLIAAIVVLGVGLLFVRDRVELVLHAAGAGVAFAFVWTLTY